MTKDKQFYVGVKALITDSEGEVLVLKKVPDSYGHKFAPYWDLPGGRIRDKSVRKTLLRELEEELGVKNLIIMKILGAAVANFKINGGRDSLLFIVYGCRLPKGTELRLSEEHSEYKWINPKEAKKYLSFMFPKEFLEVLKD
jgi:8-oxo-dGTP diphosphatase